MADAPDDPVFILFIDAIQTFPSRMRRRAEKWLAERQACFQVCEELVKPTRKMHKRRK